jgi:hypothetical protein
MAFIHDNVTVTSNTVIDHVLAHEALNHGHIEAAIRSTLSTTDLSDISLIDTEEYRERIPAEPAEGGIPRAPHRGLTDAREQRRNDQAR